MSEKQRCKRHVGPHHGMYGTPTYKSWANMKDRCGKKGYEENITYCKEWEDFRNFYKDMGERPKGTTLDRIDPFGNYCKENCRWVDYEVQENNRTNNRKFYVNGGLYTIPQLSRMYGIKLSTLGMRVYFRKWTIEKALSTPVHIRKRQQGGR